MKIFAVFGSLLYVALCIDQPTAKLSADNNFGLTPAMGFMNWERFRCNINCVTFPEDCVSEHLFMSMADAMVSLGLRDAGYLYLSIDDCWLSMNRTQSGQLQPDPDRFPSGIKALAAYMHDRGLKLGIYEDVGSHTCAGYPGSEGYEQVDADTFASWDVDMLKFDGCNLARSKIPQAYMEMGKYLNSTGSSILYLCEWPLYVLDPDYQEIVDTCNQWRNYLDVQDSWDSVSGIINHYALYQDLYAKYNGPGHFNDPDEILVGNNGLSFGQQKIQMSMWCMWSAPLLVSTDFRTINNQSLELLLNKYLIKIDQDPLGDFAKRVISLDREKAQVWVKKLGDESFGVNAICIFNAADSDQTHLFTDSLKDFGVSEPADGQKFQLLDVFTGEIYGKGSYDWDEAVDVYVQAYDVATFVVQLVSS